MTESETVEIVVVNWNGLQQSRRCLRSLAALDYPRFHITLVDNGSTDGSPEALRTEFPEVAVLALGENTGYAGACNAGIEEARRRRARYAWLLNNDTVADSGALRALVSTAEAIGTPAILAPKILAGEEGERIWSAGGVLRWPWLEREMRGAGAPPDDFAVPADVAWATGCSLFFPVDVVDLVGPLNEDYFLYLEDVDWCLTARGRGVPVRYVPQARIRHDVSRSARCLDPRILRYYDSRNYLVFAARHCGPVGRAWVSLRLLITFAKIGLRIAFFPTYRHDSYYHAQTRGLVDFLRRRYGPAPYPHVPPAIRAAAGERGEAVLR